MTPSGSAVWIALAVLLAAGFFGSILSRWRLRRGWMAVWALAVGVGSFGNLDLVNLGGGLAAAVWAALLLAGCRRAEVGRALLGAAGGATVLYALVPGPWLAPFQPASPLAAGLAAGLAVHLLGGAGRAPLIAALLSGPFAGVAAWLTVRFAELPGSVSIGGGAGFDAQAIAFVVAAGLGALVARLRRPRVGGGARPDGEAEGGARP